MGVQVRGEQAVRLHLVDSDVLVPRPCHAAHLPQVQLVQLAILLTYQR